MGLEATEVRVPPLSAPFPVALYAALEKDNLTTLIYPRGARVSPKPVILDVDPGHDDAAALMLACGHPDLDLLAVTTVAGNVPSIRPRATPCASSPSSDATTCPSAGSFRAFKEAAPHRRGHPRQERAGRGPRRSPRRASGPTREMPKP